MKTRQATHSKRTIPQVNLPARDSLSKAGALFDARKISLLRDTFTRIEAQGPIAGLVFYQKLFAREPSLRGLFHSSVELQTRKLMDSLSYTVATLERPEALLPALSALGRRHAVYGVCDHHYPLVIETLLETFSQILGASFSAETAQVWRQALNFVAQTMTEGAMSARERVGPQAGR